MKKVFNWFELKAMGQVVAALPRSFTKILLTLSCKNSKLHTTQQKDRKVKIFIVHDVVILASEPDAMFIYFDISTIG